VALRSVQIVQGQGQSRRGEGSDEDQRRKTRRIFSRGARRISIEQELYQARPNLSPSDLRAANLTLRNRKTTSKDATLELPVVAPSGK
jgi:hypothetical protein